MLTTEEKMLAISAHIGYLFFGVAFIIFPLAIFIFKKDSLFVRQHAKQAFVAQSFLVFLSTVTAFLCFLLIGIVLLPFLVLYYVIFFITSIIAAYKAFKGEDFEYPFIQGIVRSL